MVGNGVPSDGGDSTILIGGGLLTAPGGAGGGSGGTGFLPPIIIGPTPQTSLAVGVDYQACDLGGSGFGLQNSNVGLSGGAGGSGDYGVGGQSLANTTGDGLDASGNGAGGSGAASASGDPAHDGGDGSPGIWIVEEYS
jgi:hypothetical protein